MIHYVCTLAHREKLKHILHLGPSTLIEYKNNKTSLKDHSGLRNAQVSSLLFFSEWGVGLRQPTYRWTYPPISGFLGRLFQLGCFGGKAK